MNTAPKLQEYVEKRPWWKGGDEHKLSMHWPALKERFPEMNPVKDNPALFLLNGCGLMLHGRRDHDVETGTFVSTYTVVVLLVPILFISAYRVADSAGGGYYFLGKVPLSKRARNWNIFLFGPIWGSAWTCFAIYLFRVSSELGWWFSGTAIFAFVVCPVVIGAWALGRHQTNPAA